MVSFEIFVKSMPASLSELKVTPSFCLPFKIPDNPTATIVHPVLASFLRYWSPSMNLPLGTQKNVLFKIKNMKDRKNLWSSQSLYF